jgi:hypothetical protein
MASLMVSRYPKSGNSAFLKDLVQWTFGSTGQRRVVSVQHGLVDTELSNPNTYRVRDELVSRVCRTLAHLAETDDQHSNR